MTFEDILRVFSGAAIRGEVRQAQSPEAMKAALLPLAAIADKFDSNQLTGLAQRVGCCGVSTVPPECMVLVNDRQGNVLLTVADCLAARSAIGGTFNFKDYPVEQSQ